MCICNVTIHTGIRHTVRSRVLNAIPHIFAGKSIKCNVMNELNMYILTARLAYNARSINPCLNEFNSLDSDIVAIDY